MHLKKYLSLIAILGFGYILPVYAAPTECPTQFPPLHLKSAGTVDHPFIINLKKAPNYTGNPASAICRYRLDGYGKNPKAIYAKITVPDGMSPAAESLIIQSQDFSLFNGGGIYVSKSTGTSLSDYPTPNSPLNADACKSKASGLVTSCQIVRNDPNNSIKQTQSGTYLVLISPHSNLIDGLDLEIALNKFISDSKKQNETPFSK